jgi:hypothetical protein
MGASPSGDSTEDIVIPTESDFASDEVSSDPEDIDIEIVILTIHL